MASKKKTPSNSIAQIPSVRTPYFRSVYSNALKLSSSPAEVRLTFARITDKVGEVAGFINEEEVCISVHPAIARIMLAQIGQLLQNHEKLWGEIEIPKAMLTPDVEKLLHAKQKESKE